MKKISFIYIFIVSSLTALIILGGGVSEAKAADFLATEIDTAEENSTFILTGSIIELENTTPPTDILIRDFSGDTEIDYIVEVDTDTIIARQGDWSSDLSFWLVGDVLKVMGYKKDDITIHANVVINSSITGVNNWTQNGFIKETNCTDNKITITWDNQDWRVDIVPNSTKIVIPPTINNSCDDLNVGDRIRGRGIKHGTLNIVQARIIFVLRSGLINYVLRRTDRLNGTLIHIGGENAPAFVKIKTLGEDPTEYIIRITKNTKLRQRFFRPLALGEWIEGDNITFLVKKEPADTADNMRTAVLAKNNSIWDVSTQGVSGVIIEIMPARHQFILEWGPNNRRFRIDVLADTHIVKNIINPASFDDLKVGDQIQGRGQKHGTLDIVAADIIVARTP